MLHASSTNTAIIPPISIWRRKSSILCFISATIFMSTVRMHSDRTHKYSRRDETQDRAFPSPYADRRYNSRVRTAGMKHEYVSKTGNVRTHSGPEIMSLLDYRNRHAQYRSDANLKAAHAAFPWVAPSSVRFGSFDSSEGGLLPSPLAWSSRY